jgi:hypothetical protein
MKLAGEEYVLTVAQCDAENRTAAAVGAQHIDHLRPLGDRLWPLGDYLWPLSA